MAGDIAQSTTRTFPKLSRRVSDVQARVREHTTRSLEPEELVRALCDAGLEAALDSSSPDGRCLVRVQDGDMALLFDPTDGSLVIVDVRRRAA